MKIATNQFRTGTKILLDGAPCSILSHEFHKPGKGQAVVRIKYRNLLSGNVIEKTFKSNESVELADVSVKEMASLYKDESKWYFMDNTSYEQIELDKDIMVDAKKWLIGEELCEIVLWNDSAIAINVPKIVSLKVETSEPGVKGDTVSGAQKPAVLETGISIQVPLFVEEGEVVKVDTRSSEYLGRANDS